MKRIGKMGEGVLLGGILAAMAVSAAVYTTVRQASYDEVMPVHSMDIIVTPQPKIDINTADAETIAGLSGIGEVLAQRIVDWREENGPFESIDALLEVPGIGDSKLEDFRDEICLN